MGTETNNHDVIPFNSVGTFVLGMTREQVRAFAGEPTRKLWNYLPTEGERVFLAETLPDECVIEEEQWEYEGVSLDFTSEDAFRLSSITCSSRDYKLKGQTLVGLSETSLSDLESLLPDLLMEDDFDDEIECRAYECESLGLSIWVEGGVVWNFTMMPRYSDDGSTIIWPS